MNKKGEPVGSPWFVSLVIFLQCFANQGIELILRDGADDLVDNLAVFEEDQGGDTAYAVFAGSGGIVVNVDLADLDLAVVLDRKGVDEGANCFARGTPGGPKVDEDRGGRFQNFDIKAVVGQLNNFFSCHRFYLSFIRDKAAMNAGICWHGSGVKDKL